MRGIAVGRHNWLFFGSDCGGQIAAIMLTLLKSAQRNGINPFDYLADVLTRIADYPRSKVADLPPHHGKAVRDTAATVGKVALPPRNILRPATARHAFTARLRENEGNQGVLGTAQNS